jgi:hypothetical protein
LPGHNKSPRYVPKIKSHAEVVLTDGRKLEGYVFIEASIRIQDLLNAPAPFFPFLGSDQKIHLINKAAVISISPLDDV